MPQSWKSLVHRWHRQGQNNVKSKVEESQPCLLATYQQKREGKPTGILDARSEATCFRVKDPYVLGVLIMRQQKECRAGNFLEAGVGWKLEKVANRPHLNGQIAFRQER